MQLPLEEGGRLAERLVRRLEPEPQYTAENIAKAWEVEIARRIEEMDTGRTASTPYAQVRAELRGWIDAHRERRTSGTGRPRARR